MLGEERVQEQVGFGEPPWWYQLVGDGGQARFGEASEGLSRASGVLSASKSEMLVRGDESPEDEGSEAGEGEE